MLFHGIFDTPHPPSYLFAITWDVFIFRDLGFDKSTAILFFFGILKWVGTGQEELRLITGFLILSLFVFFLFVLC